MKSNNLFAYLIVILLSTIPFNAYAATIYPEDNVHINDINGESPPNKPPQKSSFFNISAREIINVAVETYIGLGYKYGKEYVTINQAATVACFVHGKLFNDSGYEEEFNANCIEKADNIIRGLSIFEGKEIYGNNIATREQMMYIITTLFPDNKGEREFDPTTEITKRMAVDHFTDSNEISLCYKKVVEHALLNGYVVGGDEMLFPQACATLDDLVVCLERAICLQKEIHPVIITFIQIKSALSRFNNRRLNIPSTVTNIILTVLAGIPLPTLIVYIRKIFKQKKMKM